MHVNAFLEPFLRNASWKSSNTDLFGTGRGEPWVSEGRGSVVVGVVMEEGIE